ncbi:hypothetical protein RUND412_010937 [Rhizina undulata]
MKAAIANGANFWNGGKFYDTPEPTLNLQLLNRYFTAHPEDESRVVLSIKGRIDFVSHQPNGSAEGVRKSVDNVLRILDGTKHLDIFQCARVDPLPYKECVKDVFLNKRLNVIPNLLFLISVQTIFYKALGRY